MTATERQLAFVHHWLHVYFEQGRGKGGVPKVIVQFFTEGDKDVERLVRRSVYQMRAVCIDSHGKDIMPAGDDLYQLHKLEGGQLKEIDEINWVTREDKHKVAMLVLTWGLPSEQLMEVVNV